jgi:hypothetical protein
VLFCFVCLSFCSSLIDAEGGRGGGDETFCNSEKN